MRMGVCSGPQEGNALALQRLNKVDVLAQEAIAWMTLPCTCHAWSNLIKHMDRASTLTGSDFTLMCLHPTAVL